MPKKDLIFDFKWTDIPDIRYGVINGTDLEDKIIVTGNSAYGIPVENWGSRPLVPPPSILSIKADFYTEMAQSVEQEGFRNPSYVWSLTTGVYPVYGCTRAWLAKDYNLDIPVFIADFTNEYEDFELIETDEQFLEKFTDAPQTYEFTNETFWYVNERMDSDPYKQKASAVFDISHKPISMDRPEF